MKEIMRDDVLLRRKDVMQRLNIKPNKYYDLIKSGQFIESIKVPEFAYKFYSNNQLQEWIKNRTPSLKSPNTQERA